MGLVAEITNVLDWRGPDFLLLYIFLFLLAMGLALLMRFALRGPDRDVKLERPLDPYQVALLRGGVRQGVETLIGSLVYRRVLLVDGGQGRLLLAEDALGPESHPIEQAACSRLSLHSGSFHIGDLRSRLGQHLVPLMQPLRELGLVPSYGQLLRIRIFSVVPLMALAVLGVAKVIVGINRGRPVSVLVLLLIVTAAVVLFFLVRSVHCTRAGSRYLASLKRDGSALRATSARSVRMLTPADIAMSMALFGFAAVADAELDKLSRLVRPQRSGNGDSSCSNSSCSTSSCSTSSCSSSSCGGGGGCGGCSSS